jgi:histidinol-phosphate aminotransferase
MRNIVPDYLLKISPYVAGKPTEEVERELGIKVKAKLASNENPLGPSPLAVKAMKEALSKISRYPDSGSYYLRKKISQGLDVSIENIILGNGSTELIDLVARTFLAPDENAIIAQHTFIMYPLVLKYKNAHYSTIPLKNYKYDLKAMAQAIDEKTKLVYIANPNNPTGTIVSQKEVNEFFNSIPSHVVVVMDEAYYEYIDAPDYPDSFHYLKEGRNIIILRSFSKAYGLAGLRVGYGVASKELISYINRIQLPFAVNALSQIAAIAALDDTDHIEFSKKGNKEGMELLTSELTKMGVEFVESVTNFLLVITEKDSDEISNKLLHEGIIVRSMKKWGLPTSLRVTIGRKEEIEAFLLAFKKVLSE